MSEYIVELENNVFIASWFGDPGRALLLENAKRYKTIEDAEKDLNKALKYRKFNNPIIKKLK